MQNLSRSRGRMQGTGWPCRFGALAWKDSGRAIEGEEGRKGTNVSEATAWQLRRSSQRSSAVGVATRCYSRQRACWGAGVLAAAGEMCCKGRGMRSAVAEHERVNERSPSEVATSQPLVNGWWFWLRCAAV